MDDRRVLRQRILMFESRVELERLKRLAALADETAKRQLVRLKRRSGKTLAGAPSLDYTSYPLRPSSVVLFRERPTDDFKSHGSKILGIVTAKYGDPGQPKYSVYTEIGGRHRVPANCVVSAGRLVTKKDQAIVRSLHQHVANDRMFKWW